MKVLMLSTDQQIFRTGSAVQERLRDYARLMDELHVIVYTPKWINPAKVQIESNLFVYSTNSQFKFLYPWDAYAIGQRLITEKHISVITAQDPFETALVGSWLKKRCKAPLQIQIHTDFLSPFFAAESLKNRLRVWLAKRVIRKADGLRVVSERIRNSVIQLYPDIAFDKIAVLSINVDVAKLRSSTVRTDLKKKYPGFDFSLLLPARFTIEKNIGMAIAAMSWLYKWHFSKRVLLLIIGDGPKRSALVGAIKRRGLENEILVEGWTNDMPSYYKTADALLLTSNYEGGARTPAEAVAVGLPVIMTDVAPANEYVKNGVNGFIVPVQDARALAEKIRELASNKDLQQQFRLNCQPIADAFYTKDQYVRKYTELLRDLFSAGT